MKSLCIVAALVLVTAPRSAAAQSFFLSPFIDTTLTSPSGSGGSSKAGFGLSLGKFGGVLGTETEVAYHPEIIDNTANAIGKSHVLTVSQSLLVGPRIDKVKPYFVIGAGDLLLNVSKKSIGAPSLDSSLDSLSNNYFTITVGGGAMYFLSKRVGARGDLRYFRAYGFDIGDVENAGLKLNKFNFWRAGFGVAFAFGD